MVTNEPFAEEPDNASLTGYFAYATPEDADVALRATLAGYGINHPPGLEEGPTGDGAYGGDVTISGQYVSYQVLPLPIHR